MDRIAWVDNVKMVAMLFVILGHTWRIIHCPLPDWLSLFILSFNMALFVIMTGYTSVRAIEEICSISFLWNYIFKITKRILVPSAVFSTALAVLISLTKLIIGEDITLHKFVLKIIIVALYVVAFYIRNNGKGRFFFDFLCVLAIPLAIKTSSFWFFSMIWCVCVSVAIGSYIIHNFLHNDNFVMLYLVSFAISIFIGFAHVMTSDFLHFFMIGYALSKFSIFEKLSQKSWSFLSIVIGVMLIYLLGLNPMNFWENHIFQFLLSGSLYLYLLRIMASTMICLFIMILTKKMSGNYNKFSFWGKQTLAMYLVHGAIIMISYRLPIFFNIEDTIYLLYAIPMTIFITYITIIIIELFMKFEITRAYCLGDLKIGIL